MRLRLAFVAALVATGLAVAVPAGVTPYLLTSDEAVAGAEAAGDVTVTRAGSADFRCPVVRP
jgi:hypothetical protein